MKDAPDDLQKYLRREADVKISEFSANPSRECSSCFFYFIKQNCCNSCEPMDIEDIPTLFNLLFLNGYEILYKETKLIKEFNKNGICLIKK